MNIVPFHAAYAQDAASLVLDSYHTERLSVSALPAYDNAEAMARSIADMVDDVTGFPGFAALEGSRLVGFIAGYPIPEFFGSHDGVYVPPHGHGAAGADRRLVYHRMYEAASAAWVGEKRLTHSLSFWAHDIEAQDAWYWLGFGLRCVDAVRPLIDVKGAPENTGLDICKATPEDAERIYALHAEHCAYYRGAPLFMPHVDVESNPGEFRRWLEEDGNHLWAAYAGGEAVSYMRISRGCGNSFATRDAGSYHVTGAFTAPAARGMGAASQLLQVIVEWLRDRGQERLTVDYESFNNYGSRFWRKHFTEFLLSPVRVIDDRIIR